jgi:hypothetical protein
MNTAATRYGYLFLALILGLFICGTASGFEVCKTSVDADIKWNGTNVTFKVNEAGGPADSLPVIQAGMQTWTDVQSADFVFTYGGATTKTSDDHGVNDGENIVVFGPMGATGTLAQNNFWYVPSTGYLLDSDIQFNTSYSWSVSGDPGVYDIQSISTHELGHSLCLIDLYDPSDAEKTMYGYASTGDTGQSTLHQDDIDGITYLYPADDNYVLSVGTSGSGTVTSSPSGISCGADCSQSYASGTEVTLTATPATGWSFSGWGGACSGTGTCTVSMTSDRNVTAAFVQDPVYYMLDVSTSGSGTVTSSPPGIDCGGDCDQTYLDGTQVTLTAVPATGWSFNGWSGACSGTGTCTVSMTSYTSVTATFTQDAYTLDVVKSGSGTVTSSPPGIDCGGDCDQTYLDGTQVTLTAVPSTGWSFNGWSGGGCSGTGTCTVSMTSYTSITATFIQDAYTLDVVKSGNGMVTSSSPGIYCGSNCSGQYLSGTTVTLTPVPAADVDWTGCDYVAPSPVNTCDVLMNSSRSVTIEFLQPIGTLSVSTTPVSGGIYVDGSYKGSGSWNGPMLAGPHTVSFGNVSGYSKPGPQDGTVNDGQTTSVTGTYIKQIGTLSVSTTPVSGGIYVDGSYKGNGSWSGPIIVGSHTVSFGDVSGYATPIAQVVSVSEGQTTGVTGTYVQNPPDITVNPDTINFGNVCANISAERTITVRNDGETDLSIGAVAAPSQPFGKTSDNCLGRTLSEAESCTITVRFSPEGEGSFNSSFQIPSNDPDDNPVTVALTGTGTFSGACPDIAVLPDGDLSFPNIYEGVTAEQTLTVKNEGNSNLLIGGITNPAMPFSISSDACSSRTLQPAGSCELRVMFAPGEAGAFNSSFAISSNDPDEDPVTVSLNGSANENGPPSSPALVYPENGAVDMPLTITMRWRESVDPEDDDITYRLYYCEDSNFAGCNPVEVATTESGGVHPAGTGGYMAGLLLFGMVLLRGKRKAVMMMAATVLMAGALLVSCGSGGNGDGSEPGPASSNEVTSTISGLDPGTTYYWKVIADDGKGGTAESGVRTFKTQ